MKITHLGHACLLVEMADTRILIDPGNFSDFTEVRDLDAVVITHQHMDHYDPARVPALLEANRGAPVYADPQTAALVRAAAPSTDVVETVAGTDLSVGAVTVRPVGEQHALIHPYVPRPSNVGVVLTATGEPTLFHPGDALDAHLEPGSVDLLAVPINAPWAAIRETLAFVDRVRPGQGYIPIHDALLSPAGRGMYTTHVANFGAGGDKVELIDLAGQGPTTL